MDALFLPRRDFEGQDTSYNNALTLRHVGQGHEACVPWVAGGIYFGAGSGQPHPFTGSEAPPSGNGFAGPVQGCRECGTVLCEW